MYGKSVLKTVRTSRCVSAEEVKDWCKLSTDTEDSIVNHLIDAVQDEVENYTNRKLSSATWYLYLDDFPEGDIVLPFTPVTSVTSVKYYDTNNSQQTYVANTDYYTNLNEEPCTIREISGWDGVYDRPDAVVVEYVTGYTSTTLPQPLKLAVLQSCADFYDNRVDRPSERFTSWQRLAYPYRVWHNVNENAPS